MSARRLGGLGLTNRLSARSIAAKGFSLIAILFFSFWFCSSLFYLVSTWNFICARIRRPRQSHARQSTNRLVVARFILILCVPTANRNDESIKDPRYLHQSRDAMSESRKVQENENTSFHMQSIHLEKLMNPLRSQNRPQNCGEIKTICQPLNSPSKS